MSDKFMHHAPTVALCVTGSIAAYKAPLVARFLLGQGANVLPVMTTSAMRFVGPVTLSGLTGEPVRHDMWDPAYPGEMHIELAERADVVAIVPATADVLARLASGRADDVVTATALAARGPVLVAPAMHPRMWAHPAVAANVALLRTRGVLFAGPVFGAVASGDVGEGRMEEPEAIGRAILDCLRTKDLLGETVLVSAGPTYEDVDPVRFLGNRSSGQMGFAIAEAAQARGARVILVAGPVALATPANVTRINVRDARQMESALRDHLDSASLVVMSAAVADYRPAHVATGKLKKSAAGLAIEWVQNPDILAGLATQKRAETTLVGFALETGSDEDVLRYGREKLARKGCDLLIANHAADSLGKTENRVHLLGRSFERSLPAMKKRELADAILDAATSLRRSA